MFSLAAENIGVEAKVSKLYQACYGRKDSLTENARGMTLRVWTCTTMNDMNSDQLYQMCRIRQEVFIVEQHCAYLDLDGLDDKCEHLCAWQNVDDGQRLIAYARIIPPGLIHEDIAIGRVLTSQDVRGQGLGRELMQRAISEIVARYANRKIRLSAQRYLEGFYSSFGFERVSDVYLEDGIEHILMVSSPSA